MNRIKELRKFYQIKQTDLCSHLDVSQGTLSGWENNKYEPDLNSINKMCDVFNVTTDYLLCRTDWAICPKCHDIYNPLDSESVNSHTIVHERYLKIAENSSLFMPPSTANSTRAVSESFLKDEKLPDDGQALHVEYLLRADYSDYLRDNKYVEDISYNEFCCQKLAEGKYLDMISDGAKKILLNTFDVTKKTSLNARDNRDIKKDLDSIMEKLANNEYGPAAYDGEDLSLESMELFRDELEIALKRLKLINKEKYNPNKNKK